jgi:glycosyltransferase involved in cell wall biosynthesis
MHRSHPVLHFTNSTLWGGAEEHICGLLNNLSREMFPAHLVCSPALYERFCSRCPPDVQVTPLSLLAPADMRAGIQLARLLRREGIAILHSHMFWSSLSACPIAWGCRVPVVIETLHGTEAWRTGWKARFWVDRLINLFITRHVAVSASDARFLANMKHVPCSKIATIHNGVDHRRFSPSENIRRTMRHRLGCSDQDVVLIVVARFHDGKGHAVLFNALRFVVDRFANVKLICLGEGDGEAEAKRICNELGLAQYVRFEGHRPDVADWLQAADINVLPSFYEGLPLTVLEAMASRVPTVASDVGGIPELVADGVSGLLVPPGDSSSLANALLRLAYDKDLRRSMGAAAWSRATQHFSLKLQVYKTEQLYLDLYETATAGVLRPSGSHRNGIVSNGVFRLPPAKG